MNYLRNILALLAMFSLIVAMLLTGFQVAIYGDPQYGFYESLYEKYDVTADLRMEMEDVMEVTDHMMAYLIGEEEELSIITDVDGREQDFFNEQDRLHMADVKNLFLGGLKLRNLLVLLTVLLIGGLWLTGRGEKGGMRILITRAYRRAAVVFAVCVAALIVGFMVDFTACFTAFHEIFFTNDLWLFDPATDYMIRMLPEGFFYHMAVRILLYFILSQGLLAAVLFAWNKAAGRRDKRGT